MGLILEDGRGSGRTAGIDSDNRLSVNAITQSTEHHANHIGGKAFSVNFSATPTGAGDCFLYIKNTSEDDMTIEGFSLWLVADEYVDIKINDIGTPVGGTDITSVNLNSASGLLATGTFQAGNDITGLSAGSTAYRIYHASSTGSTGHNFEQDIILKRNGVLTIYCQTGTTALAGYVNFNYHTIQD